MISYLSNWIIELITHSIFQVYKWTRVSNSQPNYPNCDKYPLHSRIYRKSGQRVCRTQRTSSDVPQRCFQSPIYQPISTGTATLWATHRCTLSCAWFVFFDFYSLLLFFFPLSTLKSHNPWLMRVERKREKCDWSAQSDITLIYRDTRSFRGWIRVFLKAKIFAWNRNDMDGRNIRYIVVYYAWRKKGAKVIVTSWMYNRQFSTYRLFLAYHSAKIKA